MEFDKNKILTVVTADQAKVGQKGWFAILPKYIQEMISNGREPTVLSNVDLDSPSPFIREESYAWPLFYPASEPSYVERQAQWVKENGLKVGDKVRIIQPWDYRENGFSYSYTGFKDGVFTVKEIRDSYIYAEHDRKSLLWCLPYFAIEVIKEPSYRPYNNDELNGLVGKVLTNKYTGYNKLVTEQVANIAVRVGDSDCTAKDLFHYFTLDGKPCGVKEEV